MSWIRRETEKETVQYICPHCHDYHEFREDFGERTFSENYIFCRRCGARNGTGNAPTLTPPNDWVSVEDVLADLARVTAERDAAVEQLHGICSVCVNYSSYHNKGKCAFCVYEPAREKDVETHDNWQWRGPKKEN